MNEDIPLPISNKELLRLAKECRESQKQKYQNGPRTPITIKCVVCDAKIYNSFEELEKDELAEEYAKHSSFANGAVGVLSFGYGCQFDTEVFIIGICEHCYEKKRDTGGVLFTRSYMP